MNLLGVNKSAFALPRIIGVSSCFLACPHHWNLERIQFLELHLGEIN